VARPTADRHATSADARAIRTGVSGAHAAAAARALAGSRTGARPHGDAHVVSANGGTSPPTAPEPDATVDPVSSSGAGRGATDAERLRRIESVTDAALTLLGVEDLLRVLLARVREILEVDTTGVLLLDKATDELVATAASGLIDEGVDHGVRIPVGKGFVGRVAAEATPVVVDDVGRAELHTPMLQSRGLRTLVGVPLVSEGRIIGVLYVGSLRSRRFEASDVHFVQVVADRVALAIEARQSNVERAAAAALQRSLIPDRLPTVPGLELAGRYLPAGAGGVGGDWYDVFTLPSGRVGVVMGDVIGRGLPAAVVMGRLRSALRAYALDSSEPGIALERLDRKVQHFEAGQMTTVLYAIIDADLSHLQMSSAGHPLPMASMHGAPMRTIDAVIDPPLGVDSGIPRRTTTVPVPPGAVLALFTDGLIERRDRPVTHGIARLQEALGTGTAEQRCATAIQTMLGGADPADDVALLVVRRRDDADTPPLRLEVPAVATSLALVRSAMRRWLATLGVGANNTQNVLLAVGEAGANAVAHAYGPSGGTIGIELSSVSGVVLACVRDTGRWRPPRGENRGRGIMIMERCADELTVDTTDTGTEVRLRFDISEEAHT
jgi:serine phosphatase RsbU (regulator of sigma subunit)/anti-sigma regulatory factor (Ser/Thr protein kinase)